MMSLLAKIVEEAFDGCNLLPDRIFVHDIKMTPAGTQGSPCKSYCQQQIAARTPLCHLSRQHSEVEFLQLTGTLSIS